MLDLGPIKARLAATTPGVWCLLGGPDTFRVDAADGLDVRPVLKGARCDDAWFITHAASIDMPALLAEVERLRAALTEISQTAPSLSAAVQIADRVLYAPQ